MRGRARSLIGNGSGFVLIEILVVLVLLAAVATVYFGLRGKGDKAEPRFEGEARTTLGKARQAGIGVECRNNLSQLRQMIQLEAIDRGIPPKLSNTWNMSLKCPVSGYSYVYDPRTGKVRCRTPGHENY